MTVIKLATETQPIKLPNGIELKNKDMLDGYVLGIQMACANMTNVCQMTVDATAFAENIPPAKKKLKWWQRIRR